MNYLIILFLRLN